jgi:hypothetical protein
MASILKVNELQHTGGTSAMTVASDGKVTFPKLKLPVFHATRSSNVTTASPYVALYNTVIFDTDSWYDTNTGRYTPQKAGYYNFMGQWSLATITSTHYLSVNLRFNGTVKFNRVQYGAASTYPRPQVSGVFYMNGSTDYVDVYITFSGGANSIWPDIMGNNFTGHYIGSA